MRKGCCVGRDNKLLTFIFVISIERIPPRVPKDKEELAADEAINYESNHSFKYAPKPLSYSRSLATSIDGRKCKKCFRLLTCLRLHGLRVPAPLV